eukprot:snap_masked-scaffold_52-processed-gene-1.73-mRNA-1 protein AED:1.00 eAED:1.00 QI:0/-1/0/0/-1/1/1/0/658
MFNPRSQFPVQIYRIEYFLEQDINSLINQEASIEVQGELNKAKKGELGEGSVLEEKPESVLNKNALHFATLKHPSDMFTVKNLLNAGYRIEQQTSFGFSALSFAVYRNNEDLLRLLLEHLFENYAVEDTDFYTQHLINYIGLCPISIALVKNNLNLVFILLEYFNDLNYEKLLPNEPLNILDLLCATTINDIYTINFDSLQLQLAEEFTKEGKDLTLCEQFLKVQDSEGILNLCITYDNFTLFKYFLRVGVGESTKIALEDSNSGVSPLHYACCQNRYQMFNRVGTKNRILYLKKLLKDNFDANISKRIEYNNGEIVKITPLFVAIQGSTPFSLDIVKDLLNHGAKMFSSADYASGHTFFYAIKNQVPDILELFLKTIEKKLQNENIDVTPVDYAEEKMNTPILDKFNPSRNFENKIILDILLKYGLSKKKNTRSYISDILFERYHHETHLLYFQYLIRHIEDYSVSFPGIKPVIVSCALAGSVGLPLVLEMLQKEVCLDISVQMKPCQSKNPHRIYRWDYKSICKKHLKEVGELCFACDSCNRYIGNDEFLMECDDDKNKKNACSVCLCEECSFLSGSSIQHAESTVFELIYRIPRAEKLFFCNLFLFLETKFGRKIQSQGRINTVSRFIDAGITDDILFAAVKKNNIALDSLGEVL